MDSGILPHFRDGLILSYPFYYEIVVFLRRETNANSLDTSPSLVLLCDVPEDNPPSTDATNQELPPAGAQFESHSELVDGSDLVSVQEAAALLGISDATVRQAILGGRLDYVRKYNRKLISRAAVEEYRARRGGGGKPRGRPKKQRE